MRRLTFGKQPASAAVLDEGLVGGEIARLIGLSPETTRLVALALLVLLVYSHGRAIARTVGIVALSFVITLWAVLRKMRRAIFGTSLPPPPSKPRSVATAASWEAPPLPAVKPAALVEAAREVVRLHDACDVLEAARLLDAVDAGLPAASHSTQKAVSTALGAVAGGAASVRSRREATLEALQLFVDDAGWTGSLQVFGATTRFRRKDGSGAMTVRVDGVIEGAPLADVLAVWREVSLFSEWIPSCTSSTRLRLHGHVDMLIYMTLNVLGLLTRDAVLHGYGVDCLDSHGTILVLAKSVEAHEMPADASIFPPEPSWPLVRMQYRRLQVSLEPLSPMSTRATLLMEIDPKLRVVPQSVVESVLRMRPPSPLDHTRSTTRCAPHAAR